MDDRFAVVAPVEVHHSLGTKRHLTFLHGIDRVVLTHFDVSPGKDACAALTDNNVARAGNFSRIELNPKVLWVRVS